MLSTAVHMQGMSAQQAFSTLDVCFDMATGSAQTMPSYHAMLFACGEHCVP